MSEFESEVSGYFGQKWGRIIVLSVGAMLICFGFMFFMNIWPFSVASGVVNKVINPTSIVSNYEWFTDQYNSILSQKANIEMMSKDSKELQGMIMVLNGNIAEYNSRSRQITRNMWKSQELPFEIPLYTGGTK